MPATASPTRTGEPHDVGDGQRDHGLVPVEARRPQGAGGRLSDERSVGERGPLGTTGGARGVEERGDGAGLGGHRRLQRFSSVDRTG